jgi:hypothetical protein
MGLNATQKHAPSGIPLVVVVVGWEQKEQEEVLAGEGSTLWGGCHALRGGEGGGGFRPQTAARATATAAS